MALTLEAVVSELEEVDPGAGLAEVCKAIGHGSLMGARGNSGVILSQLLRGMSERMGGAGEAGVSPGAGRGDGACRRVGPAGRGASGRGDHPDGRVGRCRGRRTRRARRRAWSRRPGRRRRGRARRGRRRVGPDTPEMLPVLAQAGVVDAGGIGVPPPARCVPARPRRAAPARAVGRQRPRPRRAERAPGLRGRRRHRRPRQRRRTRAARGRRPALRGHVHAGHTRRRHRGLQGGVGRHR